MKLAEIQNFNNNPGLIIGQILKLPVEHFKWWADSVDITKPLEEFL